MPEIRYHQVGLAAHCIGIVEAEDALYDGWTRRQARGAGFVVHGRSLEGRLLELEVAPREGDLWVVGGRDLDEAERAKYRRRRFGDGGATLTKKRGEEPLPPRRVQTQVLGLRMDDDSLRWLEEAALRHGVSASVLARMWVMERLGQEPEPGGDS
ncbi:MAG: hypothetical protein JWM80_2493 [Cyanobacteria bacterium RYN_339]|nr:hypothetical protein [Cyanobacteria bacterium RYN_339]